MRRDTITLSCFTQLTNIDSNTYNREVINTENIFITEIYVTSSGIAFPIILHERKHAANDYFF